MLRIDDTDAERSSADMIAGILDGMRWLGLDWDEGPEVGGPYAPYFQSERLDRYRDTAERLVANALAYRCYCTPERLRAEREQAKKRGEGWRYDRTCLKLDSDRRADLDAAGTPNIIRFKVPEGKTAFDDVVRGRIEVAHDTIEDLVLVRSDGRPTYHLSNVVDDIDMAITHVLRGDDHISNTPKHILLFQTLGAPVPTFAHLPIILGADRKRLSKRHGATSIGEYRDQGFLPDAMVNFLALLGWSPSGDREVMSRADLVESFSLSAISGGNAVFDPEKLEWMCGQHISLLSAAELATIVTPALKAEGLWPSPGRDDTWLRRLLHLLQPRAKRISDFPHQARPFLVDTVEYEPGAVRKHLTKPGVTAQVEAAVAALRDVEPFDEARVETVVRDTAQVLRIKAGVLIHPIRVALTGRTASPGIFETIVLLGRERTLARLEAFLARPEAI